MKEKLSLKKTSTILVRSPALEGIPESQSALFKACFLVAHAMKFTLVPPPNPQPKIEEICDAARIRYRKIRLAPGWWRDIGPFVGFLKTTGVPVACLPLKHGTYQMIHPVTEAIDEVDEDSAKLLQNEAFMLYLPLAEKAGRLRDLFAAFFKGNAKEYVHFLVASVLAVVVSFLVPIGYKILFDYVIPNYNYTLYTQITLALVIASISSAVFAFTRMSLVQRFAGIFTHRLQLGFWDHTLRLSIQFFRQFSKGDLLQRSLLFDAIRNHLGTSVLSSLVNGIFGLLYFVMMLYYSWALTLIGTFLVLVWLLFAVAVFFVKVHYSRIYLVSIAKLQVLLVQMMNAINKIRSAALESRFFSKWSHEFSHSQYLYLKMLNWQNFLDASQAFIKILFFLALYGYVIYTKTYTPESKALISVGSFLAFTAAFTPFTQSILGLASTLGSLIEVLPNWERVRPILSAPLEEKEAKANPGQLKGNISVQNLSFRYHMNAPLVLHEIKFSVKAGQFIGIVGKSGCGKSTLFRLLFGLEQPEKGDIVYDQQNLASLILEKTRQQIGYTFSNNKIFTGNIFDNITCGRSCSAQEIEEVLMLSTFDEDLKELPMGMDTLLSSIGGILSGGQKQKLLLARALLSKPKILFIDEGLNSIDTVTQTKILHNLRSLQATILMASHSLNILQKADHILVMEAGTITASGSFQELSAQTGIFKNFIENQLL
jgi:NHLM bacteriocin system ABC transporter ATP-binding protein